MFEHSFVCCRSALRWSRLGWSLACQRMQFPATFRYKGRHFGPHFLNFFDLRVSVHLLTSFHWLQGCHTGRDGLLCMCAPAGGGIWDRRAHPEEGGRLCCKLAHHYGHHCRPPRPEHAEAPPKLWPGARSSSLLMHCCLPLP